ncbi:MAG TPA: tyrosine-type recombinase/integrase [Gemmatimonadales bacterium]|nr:tyrosine-type recombinase/integrase [Gemmatimonadales bacterium]
MEASAVKRLAWQAAARERGLIPQPHGGALMPGGGHPAVGEAFLFTSTADPSRPIERHAATNWLRDAERLAELEHVNGLGFHGSRRRWATARKGLPLADVAEAGGWTKDSTALLTCYTMADDETTEAVVLHERPVRAAR